MSNSKTVDFEPSYERPVSDAQLNANRANSQHSTGPRSDEGKAKSSLNAIKTGLTGRTSQTRSVSVAQAVSPGGFACVSPFVIHL